MNLEIFKVEDKSGKYSKESFIQKNHNEEYEYIISFCQENKIYDLPFKEKVYLCVNNIKVVPKCNNKNCNSKVNFKNSNLGYYEYCSNKCVSSDPKVKEKKEKKSLERFGTKAPSQAKEIKEKTISTNQNRYGGNSPMSSIDIQNKAKETLFQNYSVYNSSQSKEIVEKRIESFKKNINKFKILQ
jgi:hypothetical protein